MTAIAVGAQAPARRHISRSWRAARIVPLVETAYRSRLILLPMMLGIQIFLYYRLWLAVFANSTTVAGLGVRQVVTYSTIALLVARIRWSARTFQRDSIPNRIREGTIVYLFLRPITARRYAMIRALGEMGYGGMWALGGFVVMAATGAIDLPHSAAAAAVFVLSVLLGQTILFLMSQCVELVSFWLVANMGVERLYYFAQDLLAGVFVPLWFLPGWLFTAARFLPFGSAINVPISLYVGRIPLRDAPGQLLQQLAWVAVLLLVTRHLWKRASARVLVQGG
ncbi:MAG: ABC-2 family transporter protein [Actinomycetota bacterium]